MNAQELAKWLVRQGHRIWQTESSYWYDAAPGVLQAFPYHRLIRPSRSEINQLMWRHGVIAVRYSAPFGFSPGMVSYHMILRAPYSLSRLRAQARNGVKTGMKVFQIEQISFERLAREGWELRQDTLVRQARLGRKAQQEWHRLCSAAIDLPGFEAWAALREGQLAAAVIVARLESNFSFLYSVSHRKHLRRHVNNALFYAVSQELLQREGIESIFYTLQPLDAPPTVDDFKHRMGFQPLLIKQCVDFHPLCRPFVTPGVAKFAQALAQRFPSNDALGKSVAMVRNHLEGLKPVEEQAWPRLLLPERSRLILLPGCLSANLDADPRVAAQRAHPRLEDSDPISRLTHGL